MSKRYCTIVNTEDDGLTFERKKDGTVVVVTDHRSGTMGGYGGSTRELGLDADQQRRLLKFLQEG